ARVHHPNAGIGPDGTYPGEVTEAAAARTDALSRSWQLFSGTVASAFGTRGPGLPAGPAFFPSCPLPPPAPGGTAPLGLIANPLPPDTVQQVEQSILDGASTVLNATTIQNTLKPLLDDVVNGGGIEVTAFGLVLMLWSGSRWLNVYVDTITIMYGLEGRR